MKYRIALGVLAAAAATAAIAAPRPVMVANNNDGICTVTGEVVNLSMRRDDYLSVRAGPAVRERELDRLHSGFEVMICDATANNAWYGVVYNRTGNQDCFIGQTSTQRRPYRGPCRFGWVSARYLRIDRG
jgi:uncharacterized protein YgiM (DUF1202 family)